MKNEKRYYQRVEKYYNTASRNNFYSETMKDIMLILLPVLGIVYAADLTNSHFDDLILIYVSILMFMSTIGFNFVAHYCSAKCNHEESDWAEAEMTRLNDEQDEKASEPSEAWQSAITIFNYASYGCLAVSFVLFFMLVSL